MATLHDLQKDFDSVALLLRGLQMHYEVAISTGRIEEWRKAAHAVVDLVGDLKVERRSALSLAQV